SQRLSETNKLVTEKTTSSSKPKSCRVITVASAKDGYGKTTFSSTMSQILSVEANKKTLVIDLDLYFAGITQKFGLHSPKSIVDVSKKILMNDAGIDIANESVRVSNNLYIVPAPRNFLEAEQVHADDVSKLVKHARKSFDYIIIDSGSVFDENLFVALDIADFIFFVLDFSSLQSITDNVRFLHGISRLSYPREKLILLANNVNSEFSTNKTSKVFPYPIIGSLPNLPSNSLKSGKTQFEFSPQCPYCEMQRLLIKQILDEKNLETVESKNTIFNKLFGGKDAEQMINLQLNQLQKLPGGYFAPIISNDDVRSQVKFIRYNMMFGYLNEARDNLLAFMEYSSDLAPLLELYGEIMLVYKDTSQALEAFQKAVNLDPERHLAQGYLSSLTGSKEKLEKAIQTVEAKIEKNPTHLDLLNDYGKILLRNEKYEDAYDKFCKALESNPNYVDAKINKAIAMSYMNKADQAIELLLGMPAKSPRIYFTLGKIFYNTGRLHLSYQAYKKGLSLYPNDNRFHTRLTELSNYMQKLESLIDLHERFVNTNPSFPDLHAKLGNFYHLAGKSELAIEEFKKALSLNPEYKYAEIKLEGVQKDMIWRLAKTQLEEHIHVNHEVTKNLTVDLSCECIKHKNNHYPDDIVVLIKNVRTARTIQKAINRSQMEQGFVKIDCSPLGLVAAQDILLFQMVDVKSKKLLRFEPHYLTPEEIRTGNCKVILPIELSAEHDLDKILPKYFLVHLDSKQFAETISNAEGVYKAIIKNQTNGLEAEGHINPENEDQINFVFKAPDSTNGDGVVKPGDRMTIKIHDNDKSEVFSMQFAVGNSDIKNFYKKIVPQEISKQ
ncbi:MAG: AAA family ATPase, partial [Candidatus Rifleibacteriota bacterium]